jgi:AAA ATPase-like protein/Tn3 transposase DDE domain-containing protein
MTSALRGRDSEVRAVLALLGRAGAGQSGALVIRGEAGTGKTALPGLRGRLDDRGVLRHCTDAEIDRNYTDTHGASFVGFATCSASP